MRMKQLPHKHVLGGLGLTIALIVAVGIVSYLSPARMVDAIAEEGRARLAEKHAYVRASSARMVAMTVTGSLMLLTVALFAAARIRNDIRLRRISEQELLTQTVQLIGAKNAIEQQAA